VAKKEEKKQVADVEILEEFEQAVENLKKEFLYNGEPVDFSAWEYKKQAYIAVSNSAPVPTSRYLNGIDSKQLKQEVESFDAAKLAYDVQKENALAQLKGGLDVDAFCAESRLALTKVPSMETTGEIEPVTFVTHLEYASPAQITPEMSDEHNDLLKQFDKLLEKADAVIAKNDERRSAIAAKATEDVSLPAKLEELKHQREEMVLAGKDATILNDKMADIEVAIVKDATRVKCNKLDLEVLERQRMTFEERREAIAKVRDEVERRRNAVDAIILSRDFVPLSLRLKEIYEAYRTARDAAGNQYQIPYFGNQIDLERLDSNEVPMTAEPRGNGGVSYEAAALTDIPDGTTVLTELPKDQIVITHGRSRWTVG